MEISQEKLDELLKDAFQKGKKEGMKQKSVSEPVLVANPEITYMPNPPFCAS